jgi:nitroimidazol reductase NimA-like FMN-containing flavoprotein (pyridoxamine 5'-phosphate oxidase superfamily)
VVMLEGLDLSALRRLFRDLQTVHVGSVSPDGWPHVVPLWFVWLEEAIYVSCRRGSRVERNLASSGAVALTFDRGRAWTELAGAMVSGVAEFLTADHPAQKRALSSWFEKYRGELSGTQFGVYVEQVPEPAMFRVVPDRVAGWTHSPLFD